MLPPARFEQLEAKHYFENRSARAGYFDQYFSSTSNNDQRSPKNDHIRGKRRASFLSS